MIDHHGASLHMQAALHTAFHGIHFVTIHYKPNCVSS